VVGWRVVYTRQAQKDAKKLSASGLRKKAESLLAILKNNPFQTPPPFENLLAIWREPTRDGLIFSIDSSIRFSKMNG